MILSATGLPFTDTTAAELKARVLSAELGEPFEVVPHPNGGYAVTKKNGAQVAAPTHDLTSDVTRPPEKTDDLYPWDNPAQSFGEKIVNKNVRAKPATAALGAERSVSEPGDLNRTIHLHPAISSFWVWLLVFCFGAIATWSPRLFLIYVLNVSKIYVDNMDVYGVIPLVSMLGAMSVASAIINTLYGYYVRSYLIGRDTIETNFGLISRKIQRIEYHHIRSVNVDQGLIGRALKYGTVEISTAAREGGDLIFKDIVNPTSVQEEIYRRKKAMPKRPNTADEDE
ncbi:MAG: PH domain-containing protein [Sulfuricaulis sp.]